MKELIEKKEDGVIKKVYKSNYNEVLKKLKKNDKNEKWTDPDFPPEQSSIGELDDLPVRASWKRIPEVVKNPLFVEGKI